MASFRKSHNAIAIRMLYAGRYHISSVFCDYVWTGENDSNTLCETSVFRNIRIRVEGPYSPGTNLCFGDFADQINNILLIFPIAGMDRTYQKESMGKYGFACKVVPEYSEQAQKTYRGCLHRRGTKRFPVKAQGIVPASHYFKVIN
jgi:hypothetical protein